MAGSLAIDVGDGLAAGQPEPGPPAPHVHHGGHDPRAGQADRGSDLGPGGELALDADLGAAPSVRPPGHARARTCRWPGSRAAVAAGPGMVAAASHPPVAAMTVIA